MYLISLSTVYDIFPKISKCFLRQEFTEPFGLHLNSRLFPSRRLRLPTPLQSMPRWGPRLWSRRQRRQRRWWCPACRKGHPCAAILDDIGARHDVLRLLVARSSGIFSSLWALKPGNFSNSQLTDMISKSQTFDHPQTHQVFISKDKEKQIYTVKTKKHKVLNVETPAKYNSLIVIAQSLCAIAPFSVCHWSEAFDATPFPLHL